MPCTDGGVPYEDTNKATLHKEFTHNSELADIMCELMQWLARKEEDVVAPARAYKWWKDHKERDRLKVAAERERNELRRLKDNALAKLTTAEKKVLGLK